MKNGRIGGSTELAKFVFNITLKTAVYGGIPGLVVMGDDSCLRGRGSWRWILDGHFSQ